MSALALRAPHGAPLRYVALEKENDQKDDQDQQQNATTDIHLQPPWSQVIRLDTRFAEEINPTHVRVHKVLKTAACELGDIKFAGNDSPSELLGIFQVSILHNIVHLLFGVAGLALSRTRSGSLSFLLWGGVIYLVLFLYGLFIDQDSDANFVAINTADNWLHVVLGAGLLGGWFISKGAREGATDRPATTTTPRPPAV